MVISTHAEFFSLGFYRSFFGLVDKSPVIFAGSAIGAGVGYLVAGKRGAAAVASVVSFALSLLYGPSTGCCLECVAGHRPIADSKKKAYSIGTLLPTLISPICIIFMSALVRSLSLRTVS